MSRMSRTPATLLPFARRALVDLRAQAPLVQCITNSVVVNTTANVLLALGAAPAMVDIPEEAEEFAASASGLLINLGTPAAEHRAAMHAAVAGADGAGTPWVLDPVAVGTLPVRTKLATTLCAAGPTVIRGNASEILAVAGAGSGGRGVDATEDAESASGAAATLAARTGAVVAVSGPVDVLTDGRDTIRIHNGHPLLTRVTGGGCALGAVIAAFAATDTDRLATTAAAVLTYTVAAEIAAEQAGSPGSFAVALLDALSTVDGSDLAARAVLS